MKPTNTEKLEYSSELKKDSWICLYRRYIVSAISACILSGSSWLQKELPWDDACSPSQYTYTSMEGRYIHERRCSDWETLTTFDVCSIWENYTLTTGTTIWVKRCTDDANIKEVPILPLWAVTK